MKASDIRFFWPALVATILGVGLMIFAYSDDSYEEKVLNQLGYTDVQVKGWAPLKCAESDLTSKNFVAKNERGGQVQGVVCCGIFKSCTVRW